MQTVDQYTHCVVYRNIKTLLWRYKAKLSRQGRVRVGKTDADRFETLTLGSTHTYIHVPRGRWWRKS